MIFASHFTLAAIEAQRRATDAALQEHHMRWLRERAEKEAARHADICRRERNVGAEDIEWRDIGPAPKLLECGQ
jgi:hypothetical protein